jgi:HSP20 family protein
MNNALIKHRVLPPVFGLDVFDNFLSNFDFERTFDMPNQVYPTDVVAIKDKEGKVICNEIHMTLAGIPKEDINIDVEDDILTVNIKKTDTQIEEGKVYLRKGISHRAAQFKYGLHDVDQDNIKARSENGMLIITLPFVKGKGSQKVTIE